MQSASVSFEISLKCQIEHRPQPISMIHVSFILTYIWTSSNVYRRLASWIKWRPGISSHFKFAANGFRWTVIITVGKVREASHPVAFSTTPLRRSSQICAHCSRMVSVLSSGRYGDRTIAVTGSVAVSKMPSTHRKLLLGLDAGDASHLWYSIHQFWMISSKISPVLAREMG